MGEVPDGLGAGQREVLAAIVGSLENDHRIEGAWLGGSLGRRVGDRFSDVDIVVAVRQDELARVVEEWPDRAASLMELAFARRLYWAPTGALFTHVTSEYARCDVTLGTRSHALPIARGGITLLGAEPAGGDVPASRDPGTPRAESLRRTSEEFLRVLGLLPVVIGRREYLVAASGAALLRTMLMEMFRDLAPPGYRGGAMRLERGLTAEQLEILRTLPPLRWTRESAIELHLACAHHFLPAARQAYADLGLEWPRRFEDAVKRHLERELGLALE